MVAIDINGTITKFSKIPNNWNGVINYNSVNNTVMQVADGWKDVVNPTYNTATQKLGGLILDEPNYTYEVIDLTQIEIDALVNETQENNAVDSYAKNIDDGRNLFSRSYRRMYRRFKDDNVAPNNVLILSDVKKYMRWNENVYISLSQGSFYQAKNSILAILEDNQVELDANRPLQKMFEWLRDEIQAYILNEYDL
jgi:nucleoside-triphosphatase THEP1